MKVYSFPTRVAGTNIFVSHINDIQGAINYLSTELTNGIGSVDTPRVFKVAAAATGYASFNVPPAGGTPSAPASGDIWNDAGTLKFYNGTATKSVAFTDTGGSGNVLGPGTTPTDGEIVLYSTATQLKRFSGTAGFAKLSASGVVSTASIVSADLPRDVSLAGNLSTTYDATTTRPAIRLYTDNALTSGSLGSFEVYRGASKAAEFKVDAGGTVDFTSFAAAGSYPDFRIISARQVKLIPASAGEAFRFVDGGGASGTYGYMEFSQAKSGNTAGTKITQNGGAGLAIDATAGFLKLGSGSAVPVTISQSGQTTTIAGALSVTQGSTFVGIPAAPTAAADTNTTQIATTAYVVGQGYLKSATASSTYAAISHTHAISDVTNLQTNLDLKAALASPTFTGTPAAPTAAADTNTTQVATTAYVVGQASATSPVVNGTAAVGTSLKYARADHVHPTDTSRATSSHTHALDDLSDVTLTSVTTDQVLKWNGTAWVNGTVSGGGGIGSLGSNGLVVQTASTPTYAARTITGTSNEIEVTNGDGVAGNPSIGLPNSVTITTALTLAGKLINTSTGVGVISAVAVKSYSNTTVTTTTTTLATASLTLVNNIVYDVLGIAAAQGNAPATTGFLDLLISVGSGGDITGSRCGTPSGERPIYAFDMETITGTGASINVVMKGKTTTGSSGTASVASGIVIAIAIPRGPVMS